MSYRQKKTVKITVKGLAAGFQLFYRKIYSIFLQCIANVAPFSPENIAYLRLLDLFREF